MEKEVSAPKDEFERIQRNVDDDGDFIGICKERIGTQKCCLLAGHPGKHRVWKPYEY